MATKIKIEKKGDEILKKSSPLKLLRAFPGKNTWVGGFGTPSIIWGTTTRILIIFGVPPHKYKYLK
jgi:hypothetical protein